MPESAALLPVVEGFYAAGLGLQAWGDALERFGGLVGADHLILNAGAAPFLACAGVDTDDVGRSMTRAGEIAYDGPSLDPVRPGQVARRSALMRDSDYVRTTHYNETVRPLGGFHGLFAKVGETSSNSLIAICRRAKGADFGRDDARFARATMPHLGAAIDICRRLARADGLSTSLDARLDATGEGALVCDALGRPVFANAAAQRLLADRDGLDLGLIGLVGVTPDDTRRLRAAMTEAEREGVARCRLSRKSGRPALIVRAVASRNLALGSRRDLVTVLISEPDAPRPIDREAIAEAFHLTPREAEVAALLADGASPAVIAARLGVETASVRIYLKRIFAKTEARSQASLVAMIRGFV